MIQLVKDQRVYCRLILSMLAISLILIADVSFAEEFEIGNWVVSNGATPASNSEFRVVGTLGQACVGQSTNPEYSLQSGISHDTIGILLTDADDIYQSEVLPEGFELRQNFPNPFNPTTMIEFSLARKTDIELAVYNILGQKVSVLLDDTFEPGIHQVTLNAEDLPSGVYFYTLRTEFFEQTKKLVLLK